MNPRMAILAVGAWITGLAPSVADGASFTTSRTYLDVAHRSGKVGMVSLPNGRQSNLDAKPAVRLGGDEELVVRVIDPNPLLFAYGTTDIVKTKTETTKAIEAFVAALPATLSAESERVRDKTEELKVGALDVQLFVMDVQALATSLKEITALVEESVSDPNEAKRVAAEWTGAGFVKRLKNASEERREIRMALLRREKVRVVGCGNRASIASIAELEKLYEERDCGHILRLTFDSAYSDADLSNDLTLVASFTEAAGMIGEPVEVTVVTFDRDSRQDFNFVVSANDQFVSHCNRETLRYQAKRVGEYPIVVEPYQTFDVSVSPGVAYSFVLNPEFTAVPGDSGGYVIKQTEEAPVAFGGAVVLDISLSRWRGDSVNPAMQVGVSGSADKMAFLFGLGIRFVGRAVVGVGWIIQQVDALDNGLEVKGEIDDPADLETRKEFKNGTYLLLGVGL